MVAPQLPCAPTPGVGFPKDVSVHGAETPIAGRAVWVVGAGMQVPHPFSLRIQGYKLDNRDTCFKLAFRSLRQLRNYLTGKELST